MGAVLAVFVLFFCMAGNIVSAASAQVTGDPIKDAKGGLEATAKQGYYGKADATLPSTDIAQKIGSIVGSLLAFVGLIFFILLIYAGFMWMTAGGNEEEVHKAISTITRASIGLVIISAAYLLVKFVGENVINTFIGK